MCCAGRLEGRAGRRPEGACLPSPLDTVTGGEHNAPNTPRAAPAQRFPPPRVSAAKCGNGGREGGEFVVMIYGDRKGEQILNFIFYSDFLVLHVDKTGGYQNWRRNNKSPQTVWNILNICSMAASVVSTRDINLNFRHKLLMGHQFL